MSAGRVRRMRGEASAVRIRVMVKISSRIRGMAQPRPSGERSVFRLRTPDDATLRQLLDCSALASVTYREVGATRERTFPDGYTHDRYSVDLDPGTFDRAADGLR